MARTAPRRTVALGVVFLVAITATVLAVRFAGLSAYRITTGSMAPDFPVGTIVIDSRSVPPRINRAITFSADGDVVTHVLLGYNTDGSLRTRGIANPSEDQWRTPVTVADIKGSVVAQVPLFAVGYWSGLRGLVTGMAVVLMVIALVIRHQDHAHVRGFVIDPLHSSSK